MHHDKHGRRIEHKLEKLKNKAQQNEQFMNRKEGESIRNLDTSPRVFKGHLQWKFNMIEIISALIVMENCVLCFCKA